MGLKKGQTNNPNGRPKGSQNRVNAELREKVKTIIVDTYPQILEDIKNVEPKERLNFWRDLLKYFLPQQNYIEGDVNQNALSDEERKKIIDELKKKYL
ncbi:MAG: DUF5681 domain-containing protein [Bacteroidales bacterium]|nr:DUF5681 domain-containing protein [Bacteroidales bacterium]MCF8337174.1 DUF5681 domain-containing protein [Bacteroidales bacterium]